MTRAAAFAILALAGCNAASPQLGLDDLVQVVGAQYRPGAFPEPSGGPDTIAVVPGLTTAQVGSDTEQLSALLGASATSAIVGVQGVDGAWIVTAGFPGIENPNNPMIEPTVELADHFPLGPFDVLVASADLDNRVGPPLHATIIAAQAPPPTGMLVVSLVWDSTADLDLHVIDPNGSEAWAGSPNTIKPPGPGQPPLPPTAFFDGGLLDHDGNANCHRDGRPEEDVVWQATPPAGNYVVRVDPQSLCEDASANWAVAVYAADGSLIKSARGISTQDDVIYGKHGTGGGVTALTFSQ
nr:hypothetical protein [Kofleriaceae bacterium]